MFFYATSNKFRGKVMVRPLSNTDDPKWLEQIAQWIEDKWGYIRGYPGMEYRRKVVAEMQNDFYVLTYGNPEQLIGMFALFDYESFTTDPKFEKRIPETFSSSNKSETNSIKSSLNLAGYSKYPVRKILILDPAYAAVKLKHSYHYRQTAFTRDVGGGERLVRFYIIKNALFGLFSRCISFSINKFCFKSMKEALSNAIIPALPLRLILQINP